jgi:carboxylesterase type B
MMAESGTVGNQAMQDQRLAMTWVNRNIRSFGGDPGRVAIFGESAGAISVCYHYASPASRGLFQAAIMESGTCDFSGFFQTLPTATDFSNRYASGLGCLGEDRLSCMRNFSETHARPSLYNTSHKETVCI